MATNAFVVAILGAAIATLGPEARAAMAKRCDSVVFTEEELFRRADGNAEELSVDGQLLGEVGRSSALVLSAHGGVCVSNLVVFGAGDRQWQGVRVHQYRQRGRVELSDFGVAGSVVLLDLRGTKTPIRMRRMTLSGGRVCMRMTRSTKLTLADSTLVGCRIEKVGEGAKRPLRVRFRRSVLILPGDAELHALLKLNERDKGEARPWISFARNTIYVRDSESAKKLDRMFRKKGVSCALNEIVVLSDVAESNNRCRRVRSADAAELEMVEEAVLRSDAQKAGQNADEAWIIPKAGPRLACPA